MRARICLPLLGAVMVTWVRADAWWTPVAPPAGLEHAVAAAPVLSAAPVSRQGAAAASGAGTRGGTGSPHSTGCTARQPWQPQSVAVPCGPDGTNRPARASAAAVRPSGDIGACVTAPLSTVGPVDYRCPLWEQDFSAGLNAATTLVASADGSRVYSAWADGSNPVEWRVAAVDTATGAPAWRRDDHAEITGGGQAPAKTAPTALSISPDGHRLYVVGFATTPSGSYWCGTQVVAAYDAASGRPLWIDRWRSSDAAGCDTPLATAVSADGTAVYVIDDAQTNSGTPGASTTSVDAVIAYDATTGSQRWRYDLDAGVHANCGVGGASMVVAPGGRSLFLVVLLQQQDGSARDETVALSPAGALRWKHDVPGVAPCGTPSIALSPDGSKLAVATPLGSDPSGTGQVGSLPLNDVVIGLSASGGTELWTAQHRQALGMVPAYGLDQGAYMLEIANGHVAWPASGNLLFANWGGPDVVAVDGTNGGVAWTADEPTAAGLMVSALAASPDGDGQRVCVVGQEDWQEFPPHAWRTVIAYDGSGATAWVSRDPGRLSSADQSTTTGSGIQSTLVADARGQRLYVADDASNSGSDANGPVTTFLEDIAAYTLS